MARGFRKSRGRYVAGLDEGERQVLVSLLEQTVQLLESAAQPPTPPAPSQSGSDESADGPFEELMRSAGWGDSPPGIDEEALSADPAIGRLLPDGHHDDPLAAAEFRRFSADGVRRAKIDRLREAIAALTPDGEALKLAEPEAVSVLVSLTDVRLVLAERLGLHTEEDVGRMEEAIAAGEETERAPVILIYDFLTWLQETLAAALSK